jgi:hypothetical protein
MSLVAPPAFPSRSPDIRRHGTPRIAQLPRSGHAHRDTLETLDGFYVSRSSRLPSRGQCLDVTVMSILALELILFVVGVMR